ncbi:hypothetical protein E0L35_22720 [Halomonas sp. ATBC28]|jgi:hypothetical protein|uniref:Uncharacterized protein n=1 Tax=Vreelandella titanicae BH1 TaxID=1204738 RepID=L9UBZ1_9GAMM|nr:MULTISPECIES: hypothetical protein [Halomonas]ELY22141.1 hypothetical protein HALTITAN_0692 [Halomonas titanicae BH1]NVE89586.1 hypothetical protein [Halomonas titanicae]TMU14901.1 hypothetical protein E0L35_22720 [Halomonas sp. ATBC28]|tara:strand:+ start:1786 stop:2313 length:528 start_codon:yes stop_codon:yes gene_type:complete
MVRFKIVILLLITIFTCSGCGIKTHKNYGFTEPELRLNTGAIHAKLRGTMENIDNKASIHHAPYEMLLWFSSSIEQNSSCLVNIDSITLKNSETGESVLVSENSEAVFRERSNGVYTASFNYENLNLQHTDHELEFIYSFSKDCGLGQTLVPISMFFKKQYSERNISFWDTVMGI